MNPREEQDLRAEIADAVEDKCIYMGVCPNTLNTVLSIINPKNHKRKKSQCDTCWNKRCKSIKERDCYFFMDR